jgi:hypothetical protein
MRYSRSLLYVTATTPLLLVGCSKPAAIATPPPPPPGAKAEADAVKRKIEDLKKANPNLPPVALGTMAYKMVQQEKAARGGTR